MACLRGVRVVEFAGLAPAPFCGMILSDFGADVIKVEKLGATVIASRVDRGKRSIALDLKQASGQAIAKKLCAKSDVLVEPFRRGVMEKLSLGPETLLKDNPRLIYARLTGYGQNGPYADRAGHDINYISLSGMLSTVGRKNERPIAPVNLLADMAGGGLICAFGICAALLERAHSGLGQVIDANMVEGSAYVGSWIYGTRDTYFRKPRGENIMDTGGHNYETYETKDGKYVGVGALEPQFYRELMKGLDIGEDENLDGETGKAKMAKIFKTRSRDEWTKVFEVKDACVTPVLDMAEAPSHPHNVQRGSFFELPDGHRMPRPAPLLSRSPAEPSLTSPAVGQHTEEILREMGFSDSDVGQLVKENVVEIGAGQSKL